MTPALDGGEWFASRLRLGKFIGGWVNPKVSLDLMENREISCPCQESILDTLVVHPIAQPVISNLEVWKAPSLSIFSLGRCTERHSQSVNRLDKKQIDVSAYNSLYSKHS